MLLKSLEFKLMSGQKVKIIEIPVLEEDNKYRFMLQIRLQTFLTTIYAQKQPKSIYSFKDYLKNKIKWPDYEAIFGSYILKNNA
ncbi:DUF2535 family protein [Metabacillus sediminilitoris]|uniref:DUF2535 family protein n=1 Tax=Metabacillus sediminilitoris TaxID=2567941 RepID=A0A4S4BNT4_9BACI|nr:DUF2535 family protein [Metabacillus sediminilitoris]QGQ46586.1 DUF2535 family protein [Metabacillus sediminilitoris]THF75983.1 DUF2535 family protein [Metabacillus sediminilitoris]